ncbi:diguanylate cyclase [Sphingomonas sp. 28-62-11]|uniref:sensor domain-containing diguanylate cyclase n=1 Tax=Sphingomonas sp. 28-62-11 TaxID=1970432 RepID=UPI0035A9AC7E
MRAIVSGHPYQRACLVGIGYFVAATSMIVLTRFEGGVAVLWLATALLVAELMTLSRDRWMPTLLACGIASFMATGLFGFGWVAAAPLVIVNIGEAVIGAALISRLGYRKTYLDSLSGVSIFALVGCCLATAISSVPAGLVVAGLTGMSATKEGLAWFAGHGLGTLAFAPIFTLLLSGEFSRAIKAANRRQIIEAIVLLAIMVVATLAVFTVNHMPLLFTLTLPLIIIAFVLDRTGVATAIVILTIIGGTETLLGNGPMSLAGETLTRQAQLFQVYLAVTVMTVLPVSAVLKQRKVIFRQLADSESAYKLITEAATDIILRLDMNGVISYASPSVREITGFEAAELIGRRPHDLMGAEDEAAVVAAYRQAIQQPDLPSSAEYRASVANGEMRWFEANIRGVFVDGVPTGWVSAIRDISQRKSLEFRLAHAATTDSLTGLGNRRAFDGLLDRRIDDRRSGAAPSCVAIFDIDFFKRVNDAHGHAVGDMVLETFAAAALRTLRAGDHVARLGGEEFGLILNGVDVAQASHICNRLRIAVAQDITRAPGGIAVSITVSAGLALIDGSKTRLQIMRQADDALYRAKAGGRDQLAIAA